MPPYVRKSKSGPLPKLKGKKSRRFARLIATGQVTSAHEAARRAGIAVPHASTTRLLERPQVQQHILDLLAKQGITEADLAQKFKGYLACTRPYSHGDELLFVPDNPSQIRATELLLRAIGWLQESVVNLGVGVKLDDPIQAQALIAEAGQLLQRYHAALEGSQRPSPQKATLEAIDGQKQAIAAKNEAV
jgi:hypothetical protein